ncbi:hypothetical protein GCK72_005422 [Caenorhabditis remanei]|uniref:PPM-type phosphatase domain-containing protein n=1 Tax=Caenorhabditis remanei TaxID=31234 RepID=A0A6A5HCH7_CAERE|nr:hypothetical protein GCK72_005422 [Caenorhabditis remanei]KAF1765470.1 hypothetical protein GCK72_005422 [Caenorhabditis remanei]
MDCRKRSAEESIDSNEHAKKSKAPRVSDFVSLTKSLKQTFTESYKAVDDGFLALAKQNKPQWKDGTTATTMIVLNNVIYVANIGDSKAVVARKKEDDSFSPVCLTADHNPMAHEERMRIQKAGAAVKDGRINGVIEVSRSIGDLPFKSLGIINTPDLKKLTLTENDLFAIIACDGLWKSFSNVEAVTYAAEQLEAAKKMDIEQEPNETREVAELRTVAEKLAAEAVRRKCGDNVSVIIIKLDITTNGPSLFWSGTLAKTETTKAILLFGMLSRVTIQVSLLLRIFSRRRSTWRSSSLLFSGIVIFTILSSDCGSCENKSSLGENRFHELKNHLFRKKHIKNKGINTTLRCSVHEHSNCSRRSENIDWWTGDNG